MVISWNLGLEIISSLTYLISKLGHLLLLGRFQRLELMRRERNKGTFLKHLDIGRNSFRF